MNSNNKILDFLSNDRNHHKRSLLYRSLSSFFYIVTITNMMIFKKLYAKLWPKLVLQQHSTWYKM